MSYSINTTLLTISDPSISEGNTEAILVVAHGGILRTLTRIFDHRPLSEFWTADHQPNCCAHRIRCINGQFSLIRRSLLFYKEHPQQ